MQGDLTGRHLAIQGRITSVPYYAHAHFELAMRSPSRKKRRSRTREFQKATALDPKLCHLGHKISAARAYDSKRNSKTRSARAATDSPALPERNLYGITAFERFSARSAGSSRLSLQLVIQIILPRHVFHAACVQSWLVPAKSNSQCSGLIPFTNAHHSIIISPASGGRAKYIFVGFAFCRVHVHDLHVSSCGTLPLFLEHELVSA